MTLSKDHFHLCLFVLCYWSYRCLGVSLPTVLYVVASQWRLACYCALFFQIKRKDGVCIAERLFVDFFLFDLLRKASASVSLSLTLFKLNPFIPTVPYPGPATGHVSLFSLLVILVSGWRGTASVRRRVFPHFPLLLCGGGHHLQVPEGFLHHGV